MTRTGRLKGITHSPKVECIPVTTWLGIAFRFWASSFLEGERVDNGQTRLYDLLMTSACASAGLLYFLPPYVYDRIPSTSTIYNSDYVVTSGPM